MPAILLPLLLLQSSIVSVVPAPAPPAAGTATFAGEMAVAAQARDLIRAGRSAEALATLAPFLARKDAEAAAEGRRIYSSQSTPMLLANMAEGAKQPGGAVDFGPAYGEAAYLKGFALLELGRVAEAGIAYQRALALSPTNPQYHSEYGFWLRKQGKLDAAMAEYRQAESLSALAGAGPPAAHMKAAALRGQGYVLIDQNRLDEAQARYEASLALEPGNAVARHELDYIRRQRGRPARGAT